MYKKSYRKPPKTTYPSIPLGEYLMTCQVCGIPWPASQVRKLPKYTGPNQGKLVCPNDYDKVAYGLMPYKIRSEPTVPRVSSNDLVDASTPDATYNGNIYSVPNFWHLTPDQLLAFTATISELDDEIISVSDNYFIGG